MGKRAYQFICLIALAFWMGGFTFYAMIVIPVGNHVLGSIEQGLVTQQVTAWMNWLGVLTLSILFPAMLRSRWLLASWLVMVVTLALLFGIHPRLDALIDRAGRLVTDEARFIGWHRTYLVVVTIQWFAALVYLWNTVRNGPGTPLQPAALRVRPYDMREKNMAC